MAGSIHKHTHFSEEELFKDPKMVQDYIHGLAFATAYNKGDTIEYCGFCGVCGADGALAQLSSATLSRDYVCARVDAHVRSVHPEWTLPPKSANKK